MAVQSDTSRIQYAGNNSTSTSYAVPFVFQENSHLKAIARTSAGVESVVTLTNHTGAGDVNGGTVRTAVAVPATSTLTIYREVPATQTTTYAEGGDFPAASHERALDKLTQIAQQNQRQIGASLRLTEANQIAALPLPTAAGQHVLATAGSGTAPSFQSLGSLAIGPVIATGSTTPRSVQDRFADVINVRDFGAVGDGVTDDTAAIQAAINSLPNKGGTVFVPAGSYKITSTLNIGNGTESQRSTKNSISLIGEGASGYGAGEGLSLRDASNNGTVLKWAGSTGGTVISFNGSGDGYVFSNIEVDCANTADVGMALKSIRQSSFANFAIRNFRSIGIDFRITNYGGIYEGKLNHGSGNSFKNFLINTYYVGTTKGLSMTGKWDGLPPPATTHADWYRNTFMCGLVQVANPALGTAGYATSGYFEFCDSNTFIEVDFTYQSDSASSGTAYGVTFNGTNNAGYPQNNFFYGCSLKGQINVIGTIGDHFFINFPTVDGEIVPQHANLRGITDTGIIFGQLTAKEQFTIQRTYAALNLKSRSADQRGYQLLANDDGTNDFGFALVRKDALGAQTTALQITPTNQINASGNPLYNCSIISLWDRTSTLGSGASLQTGNGSPEGVITAPTGSLWLRQDGAAGSTLYVKLTGTGNVGWGSITATAL